MQSTGVERVVCEACGHVSVQFLSGLSGELDRDRFARPIEREGKHERPGEDLADENPAEDISDAGTGLPEGHRPKGSPWGESATVGG